ncbi:MAG TPA: serine hydrolase [Bacteroidota bacterium]|nr:serine hydrolase [Bacteroidota bacterium]
MNPRQIYLILYLTLFSLSFVLARQSDPKLKEIDDYILKVQKDWNVPGCGVAIVKDDSVIFEKGFGVREIGKPEPVDQNTLFGIASCSKAFTAASIAMLVDEGKIKWDDPVTKYLPDFQLYDPYVTREMQVRDLLCHRSGLTTFGGDLIWYWTKYDRKEVIRRIRYLKPTSSFRTQFGYQNIMFLTAGMIIPAVTGKNWEDFVKERIFAPLGMANSNTSISSFKPGDDVATPHNEHEGKLRVVKWMPGDNLGPAGAINSSAHDMAQWMRLQLGRGTYRGNKLFSAGVSRTMWTIHTPQQIGEQSARLVPSTHFSGYGLGWGLRDYEGRMLVDHTGAVDGMTSRILLVPDEKLGVVVLTNSESPFSSIITRKVVDVFIGVTKMEWNTLNLLQKHAGDSLSAAAEKKIEDSRIKGTKPSLALEKYSGTYSSEMYGDVSVTVENKNLVVTFNATQDLIADLEHWHYDTFRATVRPMNYPFGKGFVQFILDKDANVTELKVDIPNPDFDFKELELKKGR